MMIPKNSRNRRKHLSNHDSSTATGSSSQKHSAGNCLPTITRTSNHNSNHSSDRFSNSATRHDNDSACSWVELDFDLDQSQSAQEKKTPKEGKPKKPVSTVNISMDLVDDEESKSSQTSNLSEDFTDKGDIHIAKGNENGVRNTTNSNSNNNDNDSVTSFGSESFAQDVNFDDLLNESLMPSCSDLGPHEFAEMSNKGINGSSKPMSFRSDTNPSSERSKPTSERSKMSTSSAHKAKKKSAKNHSSPKIKTRKKSKSPGVIQARKRLQKSSENNNGESAANAEENQKEHKKKSSRRRHGQVAPPPPPPPPPPTEEGETLIPLDDSSVKKRISPKPNKSNSSAASGSTTRRRRLRSSDSQDETNAGMLEDESNEPLLVQKDGSSRSLGAKPRKQERMRSKSKSKSRKTPSRSISNPDAAAAAAAKREIRKRHKKKTSGHESDDDITTNTTNTATDDHTSTKLRSASRSNRDGKKKIRSKSTDDKKLGKNSDGRRRRKKRSSKQSTATDTAGATEEDTQRLLESPTPSAPKPDVEDDGEETDAPAQGDDVPMENMTYSFHFRSDYDEKDKDEDGENWLNSANSSSSSLSYNSFAQFSLDVGDMSGLVTDMANLMGGTSNGNNSIGIIPDLDASVQSFQTNLSGKGDASVVFMAGKSSKVSLLASSQSFDHGENYDDGNGKSGRSARSVPTGSSDGILGKPEKQLRRRLKKTDGDNKNKDKTMINSEIKKKVRRAKSGGLERVKNSLLAGATRGGVERTKSQSEALESGTSKLVVSSAKRQERQEKASRRKKEKSSSSSVNSGKPKHAGKSKSAHTRDLSASPQINFISEKPTNNGDLFQGGEMVFEERAISLNDVDNDKTQSPFRSPKRSPRGREVRRTYSNPSPSPSIHAVGANSNHELDDPLVISPMSYGSSPVTYNDNPKKARRPSPSRQALLSSSNDSDSDEDYRSGADYSPHSGKKRSFLPKRGLERTPSSLLAGVRNHFKDNPSNMLSKMKKTFSVSGRGKDTFDAGFEDITLGMSTEKGYIGAKERRRLLAESAGRRGQVKNSLYACMSDSDSSVEISSEIFQDNDSDDDSGGRGNSGGPGSVASYNPTKADSSNKERSGPRRVNSLPIGIRRSPN